MGGRMPPKIRQLKATLRKVGAYQVSQEGSHTKWKHLLVPTSILMLSGHDGDDAKPYQEKDVRQLLQQISAAKKESKS
jgi:predicted RNA binding protein YcfA (HicA-like mRNA interferase family)